MVDQEHKAHSTISLCSADGWNSLTFEFNAKLSIEEGEIVVATIRSEGKFWDRQQSMTTRAVGELVPDYQLYVSQVILLEERLRQCRDFLENWLNNPFEFELQLSATNEPMVLLFVGVRDDFISRVDRPVFSLQYSSSRMKAESCFVIDRSCIDLFLQGLKRFAQT
jgi:hypothetical protein